jgi:hypothetical protein
MLINFTELRDTENAHRDAVIELEKMKETMETMELERAEMIAEVEAQIERALASMAVDISDSEYGSSRPPSRLSNKSGIRSRKTSDASRRPSGPGKGLRSFSTDSTLAETYGEDETITVNRDELPTSDLKGDSIQEEDEEVTPAKKKRFSATDVELPSDGMNAVDEGISMTSDKIAQKVLEIQQKVGLLQRLRRPKYLTVPSPSQLEGALSTNDRQPRKYKSHSSTQESGEDSDLAAVRQRPPRHKRINSKPPAQKKRGRSGTNSSNRTSTPVNAVGEDTPSSHTKSVRSSMDLTTVGAKTPTRDTFTIEVPPVESLPESTEQEISRPAAEEGDPDQQTPVADSQPVFKQEIPKTVVIPPTPSNVDEGSDTDFQSAYSTSPRNSYVDDDSEGGSDLDDGLGNNTQRMRSISTATAIADQFRPLVSATN